MEESVNMDNLFSATLLSLEEKINYLDSSDRSLLDNIANHLLMTHELLQNHRTCSRGVKHESLDFGEPDAGNYLGNHH